MKTLKDFIFEKNRVNNTVNNNADLQPQTKAFTFNFKDVENAEETVKSLVELGEKHDITVTENGTSVTIMIEADNLDNMDSIIDVLEQAIRTAGKSLRRSSNEQYAQVCGALERTMNRLHDYIDAIANGEEPNDDDEE
jgi:hypothetical protein